MPIWIPPGSTPPGSPPRSPDPEETDERPSPAAVAIHRELAARGPLTLIELRAALAGQSVAGQSIIVTEDDLDDLVDGEMPRSPSPGRRLTSHWIASCWVGCSRTG